MSFKLAYFVTHPIQYQAPLLREISAHDEIDLTVFFLCNPHEENVQDVGFAQKVTWDIPLLEGYEYEFVDSQLSEGRIGFKNPKVSFSDIRKKLSSKKWDAVWFHGYINKSLLYGIWWCRSRNIPFFFRAESNFCCTSKGFLKDKLIRWIVKNASGLLWVSSDNRDYYKYYGAFDQQLFFTPYAVDNVFFQKNTVEKTASDTKKILYASKFIQRKHAPMLLEAFIEIQQDLSLDAEMWFIGDGEDKAKLEKIINEHPEFKVKLLGFKNQSELPKYFSECDIFILPSEKEPFGLIINEVMNVGKAIITTDEVGAARDLVKEGQNGWVIQAGCKQALKQALKKALDPQIDLGAMGKKSLEIIDSWSYKQDLDGILAALNSLTN